jgi:hypothetical protein
MKRILIATLVIVAGCATTPPTTTELLLGTWNCESTAGTTNIKGAVTYLAGGKGSIKVDVSGGQGTLVYVAAGEGETSWKLLEGDTKLEFKIDTVTVTSAKLNGQTVDPKMAQTLIGPSLTGQSTTSTVKIDRTSLTLTAADGTVTSCTRPA